MLVPFLTYLFLWTNWRSAWLIGGAIVLVLGVPLLYLVLRDDPADLGLHPDGVRTASAGARAAAPAGPLFANRWRDAYRSAPMWQLSIAYWVCGVTTASISVHYVRWAAAEGISPATAALAFGLLSGINAIGVLLIGPLSDRVPRKTLLGAVYLIRGVAFLLLVVLPGSAALWGFAIVGGASWLATVPLTTSLAADVYGVRHLGTLAGLINFAHQAGRCAGGIPVRSGVRRAGQLRLRVPGLCGDPGRRRPGEPQHPRAALLLPLRRGRATRLDGAQCCRS